MSSQLVLFLSIPFINAVTYLEDWTTSGVATFYEGNDAGGACGYAHVPYATFPYGFYAACGSDVFDNGNGCGKCYEIKCIGADGHNPQCACDPSTPTAVIQCMDMCPECSNTHLDLNRQTMERIVAPGLAGTCGRITLEWRRVACDYTGNIKIRAKTGTSEHWYGLHIDDVAGYGAIREVKLKSSGSWSYDTTCAKVEGPSFYKCSGGYPLTAPLSVQLTNSNGDVITCDGCIGNFAGSAEWDFGSNFGGISNGNTGGGAVNPVVVAPVQSGSIMIKNHPDTQAYYLTFGFENVQVNSCGESVARVHIWQNNAWRVQDQSWEEPGFGRRWAWEFKNVAFSSMLPISVKISLSSGREVELWDKITDLQPNSVFSTGTDICSGTSGGGAVSSQSCGTIPASCYGHLDWAVNTGSKQHPEWYSQFQSITGVSLAAANQQSMAAYFYCSRAHMDAGQDCVGLQLPCSISQCADTRLVVEHDIGQPEEEASETETDDSEFEPKVHHYLILMIACIAAGIMVMCLCVFFFFRLRARKTHGKSKKTLEKVSQLDQEEDEQDESAEIEVSVSAETGH